jgi:hypothetical protein
MQDEFLVTGPVWIVVHRSATNPATGEADLTKEGAILGESEDEPHYVAIFTDADLVRRFLHHKDRSKAMVAAPLETPQQLIRFLEGCQAAGETLVGFDRREDGPAARIVSVADALQSARRAFGRGG